MRSAMGAGTSATVSVALPLPLPLLATVAGTSSLQAAQWDATRAAGMDAGTVRPDRMANATAARSPVMTGRRLQTSDEPDADGRDTLTNGRVARMTSNPASRSFAVCETSDADSLPRRMDAYTFVSRPVAVSLTPTAKRTVASTDSEPDRMDSMAEMERMALAPMGEDHGHRTATYRTASGTERERSAQRQLSRRVAVSCFPSRRGN